MDAVDCAWTGLQSKITTNSAAFLMRSAMTLGRPPVKAVCAATVEKERMEIVNTLEVRTRRQRTITSFDSSIAPATGPLSLAMTTGICPKRHTRARPPKRVDERESGGREVGRVFLGRYFFPNLP